MTHLLIELHYIMINLKPLINTAGCVVAIGSFIMVMKQ